MSRRVIVGSLAFLVVIAVVLFGVTLARAAAVRLHHRNNLEQLAKSMSTYLSEDGEGRFYPASLGALWAAGTVGDKDVFLSPVDGEPAKLVTGLPCSYESCFDRFQMLQFLDGFPNTIMVWDRKPFFGGKRYVAYFDYHVERVEEADFQKLLRELFEAAETHALKRPGYFQFQYFQY